MIYVLNIVLWRSWADPAASLHSVIRYLQMSYNYSGCLFWYISRNLYMTGAVAACLQCGIVTHRLRTHINTVASECVQNPWLFARYFILNVFFVKLNPITLNTKVKMFKTFFVYKTVTNLTEHTLKRHTPLCIPLLILIDIDRQTFNQFYPFKIKSSTLLARLCKCIFLLAHSYKMFFWTPAVV